MSKIVANYLASVPVQRKKHVNALHELILALFQYAIIDIKDKMPTYSVGGGWVAIANQKNYISLYTCSATHIATIKEECPQQKKGEACINFRESDVLPIQDLRSVIRHAVRPPKGE